MNGKAEVTHNLHVIESMKGKKVETLSLGGNHVGVVTKDGGLFTWGDNSNGQLGDGTRR